MADYWKSNDRKYCDFCKCWITDNKPSVAFHENGRRHKANVSNRISEISRNSAKLEKEKQKNDSDIRKMEDAALRSYAHDVSSRADLTARSINTVMQLNSMKTGGQVDPMLPPSDFNAENDYNKPILPDREPEIKEESMWVEAKSPDGHTYYWNVKTNESIWEKPKEGYMPIDEYHKINQIAIAQQQLELQKDSKNFQENAAEVVAKYRREELKKYRKTDSDEKIKEQKRQTYKTQEDVQGAAPIGTWQIIEEKKEEHIDLQLPKLEYCNTYPITSDVQEPPVKRFKEKTIDTLPVDLSAEGSSTFKKRKGIRRDNARQRLDVD